MAPETINNAWLADFESELQTEDSDITIRDSLVNPPKVLPKYEYKFIRDNIEGDICRTPVSNKFPSLEEKTEMEGEPLAVLSSHLNILGEQIKRSTFFIYNLTGVINGYIPQPKIKVSYDVIKVSKLNGWWEELKTAIQFGKSIYTSLKKIELILEKDPEIQDRETIRYILTVSGEPEQILEQEDKFKKQIRNTIKRDLCEKITITYYWK